MVDIKKPYVIESQNLSSEFYFNSILEEAYTYGTLNQSDIENIQLQCINLLSYKCERYNCGASSSIRIEMAESIMKSNLYTIGLYLKSLPDADYAVEELKTIKISEMYERGRELINTKLRDAKHSYDLVQKNKLTTFNYSYNSTLSENGLGIFFKSYNLEYEAHESPASIDYQLCNPVNDWVGIEFMQKYLENLYLENEFCLNFTAKTINHLLYGYDKGYKDLLINIFEQVLTAALACSLANRRVRDLIINEEDIQYLYEKLSKYDNYTLKLNINQAAEDLWAELNITDPALQKYVAKSLPKITANIENALKINTLNKIFVSLVNPDLEPKIHFKSKGKMDDAEYRELVEELLRCRHSSDKLELIREKVKSFDDLEDVLFDAYLEEGEIIAIFNTLGDVEFAVMIKRHPLAAEVQAVDLSETESALRLYLKNYMSQLPVGKQEQIFALVNHLTDVDI